MMPFFRKNVQKLGHIVMHFCTFANTHEASVHKIRNIGILAHIDAGKTTTTERMLYYSGIIKQMGEVHHGNTVTDFMPQERERGITITSAAVTFYWRDYQFNLIDTPGHIDFTMEVEQTLGVMDGAIVVLDASAGVEAQTLTVWRQADRYKLPRIIFINKMDRNDASLNICMDSIGKKLEVEPLCLQLPLKENGKFVGMVDLLTLEKYLYHENKLSKTDLSEKIDSSLWHKSKLLRENIIDTLSGLNDDLADKIIREGSLEGTKTNDIVTALREAVAEKKIVPVFIGSAYKNIGVQPLMDAVVLYLPSPLAFGYNFKVFEDHLCAKCFKIVHDKQKGCLVFFRIHNGVLKKGQRIFNSSQNKSENSTKLYLAFANEFQETDIVDHGNIAVVTGLKETKVGDLITDSAKGAKHAKEKLLAQNKGLNKDDDFIKKFVSGLTDIPDPVFFCSIEPASLAYQAALDKALVQLQREDPSFSVTHNPETGQIVLGGMGELHLDIIKDRIIKEYKVDAELGPLQIAYHEAVVKKVSDEFNVETKIGKSEQRIRTKLTLAPNLSRTVKDILILDKSPDAVENISRIYHKHLLAIKHGIEVAFAHGPKANCKVVDAHVVLHHLEVGKGTSETAISAIITRSVQKLLHDSGTNILEPMMRLEIITPEEYLSTIMSDLARRRSIIESITVRTNTKVLDILVPLAELIGYSTILRTISSGAASFTMEFSTYQGMSSADEERTIRSIRGF